MGWIRITDWDTGMTSSEANCPRPFEYAETWVLTQYTPRLDPRFDDTDWYRLKTDRTLCMLSESSEDTVNGLKMELSPRYGLGRSVPRQRNIRHDKGGGTSTLPL
jgi:hypothetical protein